MPKVYKNRKKHINPRYFMDERLEEGSEITPPEGSFPGISPADRARDLARKEMERQISGEIPPWDSDESARVPNAHQGEEGRMHRTNIAQLISDATMLLDLFEDTTDLPEWLEAKITKASDYIHSAVSYLAGEKSREQGRLSGQGEDAIRKSILGSMAKNPPSTPWSKGR